MNPTLDLLMQRKSTRVYADRPVTQEDRDAILAATLRAPTAGNMMLYTIIEIDDQALKDRLAETCDNQPFIAKAPYVLLFAADYQRWFDYYRLAGVEALCAARGLALRTPQEGDLLLACCDNLIAAHTAVVAAEALGIGSCYIGDILERYEEHRELLGLPQYVLPVTMVCFGYPAPEQARRSLTPRFDARFVVHKDRYHRLDDVELEAMMAARNRQFAQHSAQASSYANVGELNYFKKFTAEFTYEMTRSVRKMLESWAQPPED